MADRLTNSLPVKLGYPATNRQSTWESSSVLDRSPDGISCSNFGRRPGVLAGPTADSYALSEELALQAHRGDCRNPGRVSGSIRPNPCGGSDRQEVL